MAKKNTKRTDINVSVAKASRLAGEIAGGSVALAAQAAKKGFEAAKKSSGIAANEFMKGFRKGRGKTKEPR